MFPQSCLCTAGNRNPSPPHYFDKPSVKIKIVGKMIIFDKDSLVGKITVIIISFDKDTLVGKMETIITSFEKMLGRSNGNKYYQFRRHFIGL